MHRVQTQPQVLRPRVKHHPEVEEQAMRSGTLRPVALAGVAMLAAGVVLAGCGKADTGGGGTTGGNGGGELTLWTHNAGNKEELAVVNQIVADYNAQGKTKIKVQAFPQASYNDAVVAAATAKKLPCILDTDAPSVPAWAFAGYLSELNLPQDLVGKQLESTLGKYKDKLYSIGYYDAALAIFARKSVLQSAGARIPTVDKPWTADEFNQVLAKIKAAGKPQIAFD